MPPREWLESATQMLVTAVSALVFFFLDFLDAALCVVYGFIDEFLEGEPPSCYCRDGDGGEKKGDENEVSDTLRGRRNVFREMRLFRRIGKPVKLRKERGHAFSRRGGRWSDCACESCVSWMGDGDALRLHVVVQEPITVGLKCGEGEGAENVIFLHGFLSSSSFWAESVFPNLSEQTKPRYRLFAVDLLGFGKSPKPKDCSYTLKDHLEMIEKSVIHTFQLDSFHLVAHSMGCVIAIALAAKHSKSVKSITLVAPPYFSSSKEDASLTALNRLAARRIWPPLLFGSSFMSWYEHLGRCICFLVCRHHRTWESILKLLTRRRDVHFTFTDLTRHTHHSAWHNMHNVICGGAKSMAKYLETLKEARVKINVIQGSQDQVVPLECSHNIKVKVPDAEVNIVHNADHTTVVMGRENDFTRNLEKIWASTTELGEL